MINLSMLSSFEVFSLFSMYKVKMLIINYEIDLKKLLKVRKPSQRQRKEVKNNFKKTWTLQKCCMLLSTRTKY